MSHSPRHTDTNRLTRAAIIFAAWTAFGLVLAQQTALDVKLRGTERTWWSIYASAMLGAWIWAGCTPLVLAATRAWRPMRQRGGAWWAGYFGAHSILALVVTTIDAVIYFAVRPYIDGVQYSLARTFAATILLDLALYTIVVALAEAGDYATLYRERDRAASLLAATAADLRGKLDEARLHALETQLRPHFLYNTLNLIAELVHDEPDVADEMLTRLGFLLRRSYGESPHLVPLGGEMEIVRAYADILTRRYRDRVSLTIDVPTSLYDHVLPVFSLQPLVENAFRHGVERREHASALVITGGVHEGVLTLSVSDRGLPTPGRVRHRTRTRARDDRGAHGVGLRNTRERLAALFGDAAGLTLERDDDAATATLWLPARTMHADATTSIDQRVATPTASILDGIPVTP